MEELLSHLLQSRTQTHVFHLQTKSFAEHLALQEYYEGIVPLIDILGETWQGKYGIGTYRQIGTLEQYGSTQRTIEYFEGLAKIVGKVKETISDSFLIHRVEEVEELIHSTIYKLRFLS